MTFDKPIVTAPKDRRILVYVPDRGNPTTSGWFSAQWIEGSWQCGYAEYVDEHAEIDRPTLWRELPGKP